MCKSRSLGKKKMNETLWAGEQEKKKGNIKVQGHFVSFADDMFLEYELCAAL